MGKKYLLEIEENKDGSFAWSNFAPYTEPDLEQVRGEGYEKDLSDMLDCVDKIYSMSTKEQKECFGRAGLVNILELEPSEVIEKIRQYEQRQEEQIQVGDEVIATSGKAVIVGINDDKDKARYIYPDSTLGFDNICNLSKTGRHFPEIAAVLEKMRGEQDG